MNFTQPTCSDKQLFFHKKITKKWLVLFLFIQHLHSCFIVLFTTKPLFKCPLAISKCPFSVLERCRSCEELSYSKMRENGRVQHQVSVLIKKVFVLYFMQRYQLRKVDCVTESLKYVNSISFCFDIQFLLRFILAFLMSTWVWQHLVASTATSIVSCQSLIF